MRVPTRFWSVSYSEIKPDGSFHKKTILKYLKSIDSMICEGHGLLFLGDHNTGKTSCAIVIAKEVRRRKYTAMFSSAQEMASKSFKESIFGGGLTLYRRSKEVDLLIIDDLGKESGGPANYYLMTLSDIVKSRINNMKATIITTILTQNEIGKNYNDTLYNAIRGYMLPVSVSGHNYLEKHMNNLERSFCK
jgi:DNA replication protein DnaC